MISMGLFSSQEYTKRIVSALAPEADYMEKNRNANKACLRTRLLIQHLMRSSSCRDAGVVDKRIIGLTLELSANADLIAK